MVSVMICSITPARYSAVCANLGRLLGNEPHEFIGIHDAASMSEGYNRALRTSRGDVIIACHDDVEFLADDFWERVSHRLKHFDLLGVAGSTRFAGPGWVDAGPPYLFGQVVHVVPNENSYNLVVWSIPSACVSGIRVMDGLFFCGHRKVFEATLFDQQTFRGFHLYDIDFTFRASEAGFKLAVCADLMVIHASNGVWDKDWENEARRFMQKHQSKMLPHTVLPWQSFQVRVYDKNQLPAMLRSPHWSDWRQAGL